MLSEIATVLTVANMATLTAREWEIRDVWRASPYHGVVNMEARGLFDEVLPLYSSDRVFAYHAGACGVGEPVGTSFSPRHEVTFEYFEVHILSHANNIPLCFEFHRNDVRVELQLDGTNEGGFVFDATRGNFEPTGNGWGLPTVEGVRVARWNAPADMLFVPPPSLPPPALPSRAAPPSTLCSACTRGRMIIDPFCQDQTCAVSHLASTLRMLRHVLNRGDASLTGAVNRSIHTCVASLHYPRDALTREDVIDYAGWVLFENAPLFYGCPIVS